MKNNSMAVGAIALLVGLAVGYFALSGQKEIVEVEKLLKWKKLLRLKQKLRLIR